MNVVDSSGWLEYFADASNADFFAPAIEKTDELVVPVVSIFEVFKRMRQQKGDEAALQAVMAMLQGQVVELDAALALNAAKLSGDLQIPMADSMILATAQAYEAELWTQDADLKDIEKVRYIEKK
ncbi:MAG: type II toxin-antitoxin system VapC family toxin [Anaerolineales bacterium]|nr:type II toxin-antitoxin system VapC family toxin [Anaerolineales bacterium]